MTTDVRILNLSTMTGYSQHGFESCCLVKNVAVANAHHISSLDRLANIQDNLIPPYLKHLDI